MHAAACSAFSSGVSDQVGTAAAVVEIRAETDHAAAAGAGGSEAGAPVASAAADETVLRSGVG